MFIDQHLLVMQPFRHRCCAFCIISTTRFVFTRCEWVAVLIEPLLLINRLEIKWRTVTLIKISPSAFTAATNSLRSTPATDSSNLIGQT